jgi:hypothetical protein
VQILTERIREESRTAIIVRLYDADGNNPGVVIFRDHEVGKPPKPVGDFDTGRMTCYLDMAAYGPYMDVLRRETPLYLKIAWRQLGPVRQVHHVSIDTKQEILGEYFGRDAT